ncbi:AAA family ATPase [Spirosoma sordidisoli]|uniref:Uncharacterized protein n=1 Tax=Spirosoma sordidisoli TaxID=2502893 RepID=A0A4Q2UKC9_9BACT|nr:AAA family ATPase [Spirosoma sordidisoli]RYC69092.1 hypothetical protein EQG79_16985 [Spirosoma sordidisoli]
MKLVSFSCKAYGHSIQEINLQQVNLLVGRNGSGKSYALRSIERLADVISEKSWHPVVREWKAEFEDEAGKQLAYSFGWTEKGVSIQYEQLVWDGIILIERNQDGCFVYSSVTDKREEVTPPKTKLVINVRRDTKLHPEFEKLIHWAESCYSFRFGTIVPEVEDIDRKLSKFNFSPLDQTKTDYTPGDLFNDLEHKQQWKILDLMQDFGYRFEVLKSRGTTDPKSVEYREKGWARPYDITLTSQGTFRVFILLAYFLRLVNTAKPQLILIDDLGEGLDYSRSVKLGKFLFDECQKAGVQLIATSNDGFLMDAIPIEYWNVLRRTGTEITALNAENHLELFQNFAYTGLSNFDFFSSDYIDTHLK